MHANEKLSAFVELERQVLTVTFYLESIQLTVIEIRPHRWGWKAFEGPGAEPVFPGEKGQGDRLCPEPRMLPFRRDSDFDSTGNVERIIPFDDANRKL